MKLIVLANLAWGASPCSKFYHYVGLEFMINSEKSDFYSIFGQCK